MGLINIGLNATQDLPLPSPILATEIPNFAAGQYWRPVVEQSDPQLTVKRAGQMERWVPPYIAGVIRYRPFRMFGSITNSVADHEAQLLQTPACCSASLRLRPAGSTNRCWARHSSVVHAAPVLPALRGGRPGRRGGNGGGHPDLLRLVTLAWWHPGCPEGEKLALAG